jgi:hypothetical protein
MPKTGKAIMGCALVGVQVGGHVAGKLLANAAVCEQITPPQIGDYSLREPPGGECFRNARC